MADFSWLRVGQRPRTPSTPKLPKKPSRLSLNSRASLSPEPLTGSSDASLLVRNQDRIWYNPSLDQMVEALQVEFMTHGVLEPVPIRFNSYIIHLIEGFADAQERVKAVHAARTEAEQSLEKHLEHFKSVADEWIEREAGYKAEIKRLEVLLSKTSGDGLEAVTLARTNSVVDRNGPRAKQFVSDLKRLSTGTIIEGAPLDTAYETDKCGSMGSLGKGTLPKKHENDNDFLVSENIRRQDAVSDLSKSRPEGRIQQHSGNIPTPNGNKLITEAEVYLSTSSIRETEMRPLFTENIYNTSVTGDKVKLEPRGTRRETQPSRQILESLLGCEGIPSNNSENDGLHSRHEASLDQADKGKDTDAGTMHSRSPSGFSFVHGDDAFAVSNRYGYNSETTRDGGNGTELWPYKRKDPRRNEAGTKDWDTQSCASSVDTVIWSAGGTRMPATYEGSSMAKRTGMSTSNGRNKTQEASS